MEQLLVTRSEAAKAARTYFSTDELRAFTKKEGPLC